MKDEPLEQLSASMIPVHGDQTLVGHTTSLQSITEDALMTTPSSNHTMHGTMSSPPRDPESTSSATKTYDGRNRISVRPRQGCDSSKESEELEEIRFRDGDFDDFPEDIFRQLQEHVKNGHGDDFTTHLSSSLGKVLSKDDGTDIDFRIGEPGICLQTSRFYYGTGKQIYLVRSRPGNVSTPQTYLVIRSGRKNRPSDAQYIYTSWSIWHAHGEERLQKEPEITRFTEKPQKDSPTTLSTKRPSVTEVARQTVGSKTINKRLKKDNCGPKSAPKSLASNTLVHYPYPESDPEDQDYSPPKQQEESHSQLSQSESRDTRTVKAKDRIQDAPTTSPDEPELNRPLPSPRSQSLPVPPSSLSQSSQPTVYPAYQIASNSHFAIPSTAPTADPTFSISFTFVDRTKRSQHTTLH